MSQRRGAAVFLMLRRQALQPNVLTLQHLRSAFCDLAQMEEISIAESRRVESALLKHPPFTCSDCVNVLVACANMYATHSVLLQNIQHRVESELALFPCIDTKELLNLLYAFVHLPGFVSSTVYEQTLRHVITSVALFSPSDIEKILTYLGKIKPIRATPWAAQVVDALWPLRPVPNDFGLMLRQIRALTETRCTTSDHFVQAFQELASASAMFSKLRSKGLLIVLRAIPFASSEPELQHKFYLMSVEVIRKYKKLPFVCIVEAMFCGARLRIDVAVMNNLYLKLLEMESEVWEVSDCITTLASAIALGVSDEAVDRMLLSRIRSDPDLSLPKVIFILNPFTRNYVGNRTLTRDMWQKIRRGTEEVITSQDIESTLEAVTAVGVKDEATFGILSDNLGDVISLSSFSDLARYCLALIKYMSHPKTPALAKIAIARMQELLADAEKSFSLLRTVNVQDFFTFVRFIKIFDNTARHLLVALCPVFENNPFQLSAPALTGIFLAFTEIGLPPREAAWQVLFSALDMQKERLSAADTGRVLTALVSAARADIVNHELASKLVKELSEKRPGPMDCAAALNAMLRLHINYREAFLSLADTYLVGPTEHRTVASVLLSVARYPFALVPAEIVRNLVERVVQCSGMLTASQNARAVIAIANLVRYTHTSLSEAHGRDSPKFSSKPTANYETELSIQYLREATRILLKNCAYKERDAQDLALISLTMAKLGGFSAELRAIFRNVALSADSLNTLCGSTFLYSMTLANMPQGSLIAKLVEVVCHRLEQNESTGRMTFFMLASYSTLLEWRVLNDPHRVFHSIVRKLHMFPVSTVHVSDILQILHDCYNINLGDVPGIVLQELINELHMRRHCLLPPEKESAKALVSQLRKAGKI